MKHHHHGLYIAISASSLAIFLLFSYLVLRGHATFSGLDDWWIQLNDSIVNRYLIDIFKAVTYLGSTLVLFPAALMIFYIARNALKRHVAILLGSMLLSTISVNMAKLIVGKDRPFAGFLEVSGYSYPSGHASLAFVFYWGLFLILCRRRAMSKGWAVLLAIMFPVVVSFSRTYLQVHYLTDIFGSFFLSVSIFFLFLIFVPEDTYR